MAPVLVLHRTYVHGENISVLQQYSKYDGIFVLIQVLSVLIQNGLHIHVWITMH